MSIVIARTIKPFLPYALLAIIALPAVRALLAPGFFTSHDGGWMTIRLSAFHQSFRDGQLPVRWTQRLNNNYGYPVLNFLYPLPFYLAEPLILAGIGLTSVVKTLFVLSMIGSVWAMFAWLRRRAGLGPAVAGACLYLYTPYRFLDVYVRGSLGESLAFVFPPLIFLALDRIAEKPSWSRSAELALLVAGLSLAHNVLAFIFGGLVTVYLVFRCACRRDAKLLRWELLGLLWGAMISGFFWFPALNELKFTAFSQTQVADFRDHFPTIRQLFRGRWGYRSSVPGPDDQVSFQLGAVNLGAVLLASLIIWKKRSGLIGFLAGSFLIGLFLMLPISTPVWQLSKILPVIQFPWRFLALTTFGSAAVFGLSFKYLNRQVAAGIGLLGVGSALFFNRTHWRPESFTFYPGTYYSTNEDTTTVKGEYQPRWAVAPLPGRAAAPVEVIEGRGTVVIDQLRTGWIKWQTDSDEALEIRVNALYYPGWVYLIDGQKQIPEIELAGVPRLAVPAGTHQGEAVFRETRSRFIADLVGLLAVTGALLVLLKRRVGLLASLAVLILALGTVRPLFYPGWIPIHDDTQVARVVEMAAGLRQGQFPVRWVGDLGYGYGYPLFNYYAPLPYYFGAAVNLLGLSPLAATKLMIGAAPVLAGLGMFVFLKSKVGLNSALLGSVLYLYLPFQAVELYVRGAVAELWGMAFLPLTLFGVDWVLRKKRFPFLAALPIAGLSLSHNLTALIGLPVVVGYVVVFLWGKEKPGLLGKRMLVSLVLALGFSAFYWLPALTEGNLIDSQRLVAGGGGDFRQHFLFLDQLWDSPWGFAGSAPGRADGLSFKIGKLHLVIGLASLALSLIRRQKQYQKLLWLATGLLVISVLMTLPLSGPVWEVLSPLLAFLQYPWRFLILVSLAIALLGALLPSAVEAFLPERQKKVVSGLVTLVAVGAVVGINLKYFRPQRYLPVSREEMSSPVSLRWQASKKSDEFLPPGFVIPENQEEIALELVEQDKINKLEILDQRFHRIKLALVADQETTLFLNLVRFPGWRVLMDAEPVRVIDDPTGRMRLGLVVPAGEHQIEARFGNTPVRTLANLISLTTGLLVIFLIGRELCRSGIRS